MQEELDELRAQNIKLSKTNIALVSQCNGLYDKTIKLQQLIENRDAKIDELTEKAKPLITKSASLTMLQRQLYREYGIVADWNDVAHTWNLRQEKPNNVHQF